MQCGVEYLSGAVKYSVSLLMMLLEGTWYPRKANSNPEWAFITWGQIIAIFKMEGDQCKQPVTGYLAILVR